MHYKNMIKLDIYMKYLLQLGLNQQKENKPCSYRSKLRRQGYNDTMRFLTGV